MYGYAYETEIEIEVENCPVCGADHGEVIGEARYDEDYHGVQTGEKVFTCPTTGEVCLTDYEYHNI